MNPQYPIFIPSKGRHETPYTIRMLERMKIPFTVVVEEQEYEQYRQAVIDAKIIVLPHRDKGLTVTRNWIWDYAQNELKTTYFWTIDDNIRHIVRIHKNIKRYVDCGTPFRVIEDFARRYSNLYICGMNYWMFVPRKKKKAPLTLNNRIYSNMLIKTHIPYRNITFYNDDTDLCLRILKDGHCTMLFNAFLVDKIGTMRVKGGMTDLYDKTENRLEFVRELKEAHQTWWSLSGNTIVITTRWIIVLLGEIGSYETRTFRSKRDPQTTMT